MIVLTDMNGHSSTSVVKAPHFYSNAATQTDLQVRRSISSERVTDRLCPPDSQLVAGIIFMSALINLSDNFHGQRLNRLVVFPHKLDHRRSEGVSDLNV